MVDTKECGELDEKDIDIMGHAIDNYRTGKFTLPLFLRPVVDPLGAMSFHFTVNEIRGEMGSTIGDEKITHEMFLNTCLNYRIGENYKEEVKALEKK